MHRSADPEGEGRMRKAKNTKMRFAAGFVLFLMVLLLLGPYLCRHDPFGTNMRAAFLAPCREYLFGTDNLGRCVLCRILAGGRTSIFTAFAVVALAALIGTVLGVAAGYFGGAADEAVKDLLTVFQAFPSFVLAIAIAGIMGQSLKNGIFALTAIYWTTYAKLARSLVQQIRNNDYVKAAWLNGAGYSAILYRYILPGITRMMIVTIALDIGNVVLSMAGLSFLGLGAARPTAEWGAVMSEAKDFLQKAPWIIVANGGALFVSVIGFNLLGERYSETL